VGQGAGILVLKLELCWQSWLPASNTENKEELSKFMGWAPPGPHLSRILWKVFLNSLKLTTCLVSLNWPQLVSYSHAPWNNGIGTQLQSRSWALANSSVVEYITLLVSMSDYWQSFLDIQLGIVCRLPMPSYFTNVLESPRLLILLSLQWTLGAFLMMMPLRHLILDVRYRVSWLRRHFWGENWVISQSSS